MATGLNDRRDLIVAHEELVQIEQVNCAGSKNEFICFPWKVAI